MYATSVGTWVNGSSPRNMNHVTNVAENTSTCSKVSVLCSQVSVLCSQVSVLCSKVRVLSGIEHARLCVCKVSVCPCV